MMGERNVPPPTPVSGLVPIGEAATPAFARLPDPARLFAERAERFRTLAGAHSLGPYLSLLADVSNAQAAVVGDVPPPEWPAADAVERAYDFSMPPLGRSEFRVDAAWTETLTRLIARLRAIAMPEPASRALAGLEAADATLRVVMVRNLLADAVPADAFAEHAFVSAALQVHFARLAAGLDAKRLQPAGDGVCPACGGPPVASLVVGGTAAHGTRYCVCALCGTLWNYVRIKCTLCGGTKGIAYHGIEGDAGTVKAETCESCRGYVKILHQHKDPQLDPVADDVATLGLDLLVREAGYRRGAVNPFLLGY
jgi:FdhE protein